MDGTVILMVAGALGLGGGGLLGGYFLRKMGVERNIRTVEEEAQRLMAEATREADNKRKEALLEAKEHWFRAQAEFEEETEERRKELQKSEQRIGQRESSLDRRTEMVDRREKELSLKERRIAEREEKIIELETRAQQMADEELRRLERISGLTMTEAKEELRQRLLSEVRHEAAEEARRIMEESRETARKKAAEIIVLAIERYAADHVAESTVSVVDLPNDEMKGRIIGREGRNIRALEVATGVDLIIDDTPETVLISAFDPIRREIARLSLERLIADGRIHPARIEEMVEKVKKEIDEITYQAGVDAAYEVGITDMHPDLLRVLGRLRYRTSYTQNVLRHSVECAILCGIMAAELGVDQRIAKRAGLLHDIGKALDHQLEGTHISIGVDLLRKYNEPESVINAIEAHHDDVEARSIEAVLVQAADALSAARPGARREMLQTYVQRLAKMEEIAESFEGVEKTYAIQAGREIRVVVTPDKVQDSEAIFLAQDIA
ncbi:MAG: ribonuclease Y, partial [Candidatus Tectomicrobia bacterium]|nr:ribonuclease Y [Candidatus Tectomicrobia bacterium]